MFALLFAAAASGGSVVLVTTIAGVIAGIMTAAAAIMAVRVNRRNAEAADKTAEGNAIKAIAEANRTTLESLKFEIDRLNAVVNRLADRLNQERQWTVRLIRALNHAGVDIPVRPEVGSHMGDTDEVIEMDGAH